MEGGIVLSALQHSQGWVINARSTKSIAEQTRNVSGRGGGGRWQKGECARSQEEGTCFGLSEASWVPLVYTSLLRRLSSVLDANPPKLEDTRFAFWWHKLPLFLFGEAPCSLNFSFHIIWWFWLWMLLESTLCLLASGALYLANQI